ncbi:MAG: HAD-IIA family hydrolase [Methylococcales bacterium]|nr:HAD-IIA family hydrolase [Methylococcales bacterium]
MINLARIQSLIVDMDGVLWQGEQALPGLAEFFNTLDRLKLNYLLATNNASLTPAQYTAKLSRMAITLSPERILTSAMVTAQYLAETASPASSRLFVIGESGLITALRDQGFQQLQDFTPEQPATHVVCGLDRQLTWQKLTTAGLHLQAGAQLLGTNADTNLPTELGNAVGNGAILAALTAVTGLQPTVLGKPETYFYQNALQRLNTTPEHTLAIGDRLDTDILGAVRTGLPCIMLLSGISKVQDLGAVNYAPDLVLPGLPALTEALRLAHQP